MFPSSIFSFDSLNLGTKRPKGFLRALLLAFAVVLIAEGLAHITLRGVGRCWEYWHVEAAVKWESFRALAETSQPPTILVTGDSTSCTNFVRDELAMLRDDATVYNMGSSGNYALAFERNTVVFIRQCQASPQIVVVSLTPRAFVDRLSSAERAVLSSPFCRRQDQRWMLEDWCYLARLWPAVPALMRRTDAERTFAEKRGFSAPVGHESEGDAGSAVEVDEFDDSMELSDERFAVLEELARTIRDLDGQLVVVIPPRLEPSDERFAVRRSYRERLELVRNDLGIWVFDADVEVPLTEEQFYDPAHLNRSGADALSRSLVKWLRARERVMHEQ